MFGLVAGLVLVLRRRADLLPAKSERAICFSAPTLQLPRSARYALQNPEPMPVSHPEGISEGDAGPQPRFRDPLPDYSPYCRSWDVSYPAQIPQFVTTLGCHSAALSQLWIFQPVKVHCVTRGAQVRGPGLCARVSVGWGCRVVIPAARPRRENGGRDHDVCCERGGVCLCSIQPAARAIAPRLSRHCA